MKKLLFCALAFAAMLLTACNDPVEQVSGTYSYKISGQATVDGDETTLTNETGAMEIVRIREDRAMITFNVLGGAAYYTEAAVDKEQVTLAPFERQLAVGAEEYPITVKGKGKIYDRTIIFTLSYEGDKVEADDITMLCKKN